MMKEIVEERDDLLRANQLLQAFIGNRDKEVDRLRGALTDIAVFGCGMLSQPAAMNGPEEAWLRMRIAAYERCARDALALSQAQKESDQPP